MRRPQTTVRALLNVLKRFPDGKPAADNHNPGQMQPLRAAPPSEFSFRVQLILASLSFV